MANTTDYRKPVTAPKRRIGGSITAENKFTTDVNGTVGGSTGTVGMRIFGDFALVISGTWTGTVHIQRSSDSGVTWVDLTTAVVPTTITFTTNGVFAGYEPAKDVLYRVGVRTGNFGSGTIVVELQT